jgi:cytochrome P450
MGDRDEKNRAVSEARDFNPFRPEFLEHEYETYDRLREHLPIARSESMIGDMISGRSGGWVLTRYADAGEVLRNTADFSSQSGSYPVRPWIPQAVDPPMHTAYRRILNPWFTADAMAKLEPHLLQYAEQLVDRMLEKDSFDFVADFADPFPTVIFCELAGFPAADHARIMDWKNTIMHASDGHTRGRELARARAGELGLDLGEGEDLPSATAFAVRARAAQEVYAYLAGLLDERRATPRDDLVSKLLAAKYEGERPLTQEELEDTLFLLFMAGLDAVESRDRGADALPRVRAAAAAAHTRALVPRRAAA